MADRKTICRGQVVLVLYPNSDLRTAKLRPVLVIQANDLGTELDQVVVAMLTSKIFRANHPSRVLISRNSEEGKCSGILSDSIVMTDNLATIHTSEIDQPIGNLDMTRFDAALRHTLSLE